MTEIILEKGKTYSPFVAIEFADVMPMVDYYKKCGENVILITHQKDRVDTPSNLAYIKYDGNVDDLEISDWGKFLNKEKQMEDIFAQIKGHQDKILVRQKGNHTSFKPLYEKFNLEALGLSPEQGDLINDKIYQYKLLKDIVNMPDFVVTTKDKALIDYDKVSTQNGVYSVLSRGWGGSGSIFQPNKQSLKQYLDSLDCSKVDCEDEFILSGAISSLSSPSLDMIIAGEDEIMSIGLVDQLLKGGTIFYGGIYPAVVDEKIKKDCYEMAREIGRKLGSEGYRGWISLDFIIAQDGNVYFCEINGRYSGTTPIRMMAMEKSRPFNAPTLAEIERRAVLKGSFDGVKLWEEPENLSVAKWYITPQVDKGIIKDVDIGYNAWDILEKDTGFVMVGRPNPGRSFDKSVDRLGKFYAWSNDRLDVIRYIKQSEKIVSQMVRPL